MRKFAPTEAPILEVRNLSFSYDGHISALHRVSLSISSGERLAVLGANGAGKSTFFLCLTGVLRPTQGEIFLHGKPVQKQKELCRSVGMVFQQADDQIIASTVAQEISFGPMNLRLPKQEVIERVERSLNYMELQSFRRRPPHDLSGGEKKRVTIADILAMNSEIILLDEPAASLDPQGTKHLEAVLTRLSDEGRTLVIATHDMDFAFRWATRVIVFHQGGILADDLPEKVFQDDGVLQTAKLRQPVLLEISNILREKKLLPNTISCPRSVSMLREILQKNLAE